MPSISPFSLATSALQVCKLGVRSHTSSDVCLHMVGSVIRENDPAGSASESRTGSKAWGLRHHVRVHPYVNRCKQARDRQDLLQSPQHSAAMSSNQGINQTVCKVKGVYGIYEGGLFSGHAWSRAYPVPCATQPTLYRGSGHCVALVVSFLSGAMCNSADTVQGIWTLCGLSGLVLIRCHVQLSRHCTGDLDIVWP